MNVTTATPAQIDTEIARINAEIANASVAAEQAETTIARIDSVQGTHEAGYPWNSQAKREEAAVAARNAEAALIRLQAEVAPLHAEFTARGGWNRYYWVTNTGGHIHHTTACDTCFTTTGFSWMTEQSGMAHADLVEAAGEKACTVCFPNAPVDVLRRKTTLTTPERAAKAAEKAAKDAAKADAARTIEWVESGRSKAKTFKTLRGATNALAGELNSLCWYGETHPMAAGWAANVQAGRDALGTEWDYDKALAAARKKAIKDGGQSKW